jgi:endonuclease/exonuclease/phosphatase (EEP) superfamily protein YafD
MKQLLKNMGIAACRLFWAGLQILGVGMWLWAGLRWGTGDALIPVRVVTYFLPWLLMLGLLPGLVAAGLARRNRLALALAGPALLIGAIFAPLFLPRSAPALAHSAPLRLKVMSYNVLYVNKNIPAAAELIRREQPDILLMQEVTPRIATQLQAELTTLYPDGETYFAYNPTVALNQAVVSRYPVTVVELSPEKGRTQKVVVELPTGPIAVWNAHPLPPFAWTRQQEQVVALAGDIAQAEGPLIVGGDFNTTDQTEAYHLINQYLTNAHWEVGWGFGFSFPAPSSPIPSPTSVVRIDHIFYNEYFVAQSARTLDESGGSDHFPVVAELRLMEGK